MGTFGAIFCRREVLFVCIGLAISALTVSAQVIVAEEFQKCTTSCVSEEGYTLRDGNYPNCNQCNSFLQCANGYMFIQQCPLGTNYFNRKLGVCDKNISVCVNDSLTIKSPKPTLSSSTSRPAITTQILNTTTVIITTTTPTSNTATTTTAKTSVIQTTSTPPTTTASPTTTSTPPTTTASPTTTSTRPTTTTSPTTTSTTSKASTTETISPAAAVYTPKPGGEADSYYFAMNLYNKHSLNPSRVGALTVESVSSEKCYYNKASLVPCGDDYRIYGVTLVKTRCANKPEFANASSTKCPLMSTVAGKANPAFVAKCNFKVRYPTPNTTTEALKMMYMMCYT